MTVTAPPTAIPARPACSGPAPAAVPAQGRARGKARGAASLLVRFRGDESGATAIEYALMAMFFSVTVIGGSSSIRNALQTAFTTVSSAVLAASNG